jgi:phosphate/sulfate permease
MSIGNGRSAYRTPYGQTMVVVALSLMIGCWAWATRVMALPEERRVFPERSAQ